MIRNFKLYFQYLRIAVLGKLQYKADFIVGIISIFILNAVNIALIGILVYNFNTLDGWGIWDLMFLYSIWMLSRGLYGIFFGHFHDLEDLVVDGTFDSYLTKPLSPFVQLVGKDINYMGVGDIIVGIVGFILVKSQINLDWSPSYYIYFFLCIIAGAFIQVALNWIVASLSFWILRSDSIRHIVERFTVFMQQYPVSIFGKYFQIFVTCFLPVAFINYYPSEILLGKIINKGDIWRYLSPVVALVLMIIAAIIWKRGIKKYSSAGN